MVQQRSDLDVTGVLTVGGQAVYHPGNPPPGGGGAPKICQISNSDTGTNLNNAAFIDAPFDVEHIRDAAAFELAANGIRCLSAGRVRLYGHLRYASGGARASLDIQFALNGVPIAGTPIGGGGYVRASSGHDDDTLTVLTWADVAADDIVTLQVRRSGSVTAICTFAEANTSALLIEQY